jgi:hypothetical protein
MNIKQRSLLGLAILTISSVLINSNIDDKLAVAGLADSLTLEEKVAFRRKSIHVMSDQVALASVMVKAKEYEVARDRFLQPAHKIWFMFGGTIKRIAPDLYEPAASGFKEINTLLEQPQQAALVTKLQDLDRILQDAVKISDEKL